MAEDGVLGASENAGLLLPWEEAEVVDWREDRLLAPEMSTP